MNVDGAGQIKIFNSRLETDSTSVSVGAYGAGSLIRMTNCFLGGGPLAQVLGGTVLCAGVTEEDFMFNS